MTKKKNTGSVSLNVIFALVVYFVGFIVFLLTSVLLNIFFFRLQADTINNKQNLIGREAVSNVNSFFREKIYILGTFGNIINGTEASYSEQVQLVNRLIGENLAFNQVIALDHNGRRVVSGSRTSSQVQAVFNNNLNTVYWTELKSKELYISNVYIDETTDEPITIISVMTKDILKNVSGYIVCELRLKFTWDLMDTIKVGERGVAYIADREGRLIAFKDTARVLKNEKVDQIKPVRDFLANMKDGSDQKSVSYKGILGNDVVGRYIPLISPDWVIVIEMPWDEAYREGIMILVFSAILLVIMTGLSGIAGNRIANRLTIPLANLAGIAERIGNGETGLVASEKGFREIASLGRIFNMMTAELVNKAEGFRKTSEFLSEIITKATDITLNLNSVSREIESAAQEQTSGSTQQASGITEVSSTLIELSLTAKQITKNVGELVLSSGEVVKSLQEIMQELLRTISQLDDVGKISTGNSAQIGELNKRSVIINEMVELIKEIAGKTNILSINASIEASRSGEAGSGFAVVASEIRELSRETIASAKNVEKATKEIRDFIDSIVISAKTESVKVLESGNTVKNVFGNIEKIVTRINNNYSFTQRIDTSIKQQESGSSQASDTMRQIAEIARQAAEIAAQTLKAVRDIVNLAAELDRTIKKIKPDQ